MAAKRTKVSRLPISLSRSRRAKLLFVWGIDLGGTKIEGVILSSLNPLTVLCRRRLPTEADQGYDHILARIEELVSLMEGESGLKRPPMIGIGTPGAVEPSTGLM